jgi:hypothetical protein
MICLDVHTPKHGPWPESNETICVPDGKKRDEEVAFIVTTPRQGPFAAEREKIVFDKQGQPHTAWRKRYT